MVIKAGYNGLQITLHWTIAVLIATNYLFGGGMGDAFDHRLEVGGFGADWTATVHVSVGIAVLLLTLVRLTVRREEGVPTPKETRWPALDVAALWVHRLLYAFLILVPTLGLIAWFGEIAAAGDIHVYVMDAMMLLILLHTAAALFHHFVLKDGLIWRMLSPK